MNMGLNEEQMRHLVAVLNDKVGKREADIAEAELEKVLERRSQ